MRMGASELRLGLVHFAKHQAVARLEAHRDLTHFQIEHDLIGIRLLAQIPCRTQRRVSREAQFFIHGKDADLVAFGTLHGFFTRQDECGLAQIGLARQFLHLRVAEAASIGEDGKLITLQRARGENVKLNKGKFAPRHFLWLRHQCIRSEAAANHPPNRCVT